MTELSLPLYAQKHIRQVQAQIMALQNQLQQFVDGCACGMGVDMTQQIDVNLETMIITIQDRQGDALPVSLASLGLELADESQSQSK